MATRVSGLASGMDTDTIIADLMKAQRTPINKITQKKTYTEWQLDSYRSVNKQLNDFSTNLFDNFMKSATFFDKTVSTSSNAVSIKSVNATSDFAGKISVSQLASQATMKSSDSIGNATNLDTKKTMATLGYSGAGTITINTIDANGKLEAANAKTITFDPTTDSLDKVLEKINKETGVSAFYDSFTGQISLTAKNSGDALNTDGSDAAEIVLNGDLAAFFKLDSDNLTANGQAGSNAKFIFNGLETERSTNSFKINGFEVTLKEVTTGDVTFSSATNTDKVFENIKNFVDSYNKMIEDLNSKIRETKYRDYQPLSTEEKAEMKDSEIELWEEKAKSGTLKNEPIITSMLQKMRSAFSGSFTGSTGETLSLSSIGITTSSNYKDNGKLVINEAKLKEAINSDPNKVYETFTKSGTTDSEKGLATRLRSVIEDSRKLITAKAGSTGSINNTFTIGRSLNNYDEQIKRLEARLELMETRYYKQFTAMETAIQKANSQSAYLTNAFSQ